ncbi:MAG: DUF4405 domain-containing protein [Opitutales bacterium]|nr:DUF4405 domain-containing protein [Opitutales bacterium]
MRYLKLATDAILAALTAILAARLESVSAHEILGMAAAASVGLHAALNFKFFKNIFKEGYSAARILNSSIIAAMALFAIVSLITGALNSQSLFSFLGLDGSLETRRLHAASAYWLFVLAAVHAGLNIEKAIPRFAVKTPAAIASTAAICILGAFAFFERGMPAKLFKFSAFDFSGRGAAENFALNLCVFFALAISAFCLKKFLTDKQK